MTGVQTCALPISRITRAIVGVAGIFIGWLLIRYVIQPLEPPAAPDTTTETIETAMWACQARMSLKDLAAFKLVRAVRTSTGETCIEFRSPPESAVRAVVFSSSANLKPVREAPDCNVSDGRDVTPAFASAFGRCPGPQP